jgi:hypothetical protein
MKTGWEEINKRQGEVSNGASRAQSTAPPQGLLALALGPCHGPTCNSELDMGTDLALWPVGGNAGVVASIISGHSGKV